MNNAQLAVVVAGFAKMLTQLILHCTAYSSGNPEKEERKRQIEEINRIADEIDKNAKAITMTYRETL